MMMWMSNTSYLNVWMHSVFKYIFFSQQIDWVAYLSKMWLFWLLEIVFLQVKNEGKENIFSILFTRCLSLYIWTCNLLWSVVPVLSTGHYYSYKAWYCVLTFDANAGLWAPPSREVFSSGSGCSCQCVSWGVASPSPAPAERPPFPSWLGHQGVRHPGAGGYCWGWDMAQTLTIEIQYASLK